MTLYTRRPLDKVLREHPELRDLPPDEREETIVAYYDVEIDDEFMKLYLKQNRNFKGGIRVLNAYMFMIPAGSQE